MKFQGKAIQKIVIRLIGKHPAFCCAGTMHQNVAPPNRIMRSKGCLASTICLRSEACASTPEDFPVMAATAASRFSLRSRYHHISPFSGKAGGNGGTNSAIPETRLFSHRRFVMALILYVMCSVPFTKPYKLRSVGTTSPASSASSSGFP